MAEPQMPTADAIYAREGNFAVFHQLGVKLDFPCGSDEDYYDWLNGMIASIGNLVPGAEIAEKSYARTEPRLNTGVYYDTDDYYLLRRGLVLRTTCNRRTHAFCAFKQAQDERGVMLDRRFVFEGDAKKTIQEAPTSAASVAFVQELLMRRDIEHPGTHLERATGIRGSDLSPAMCLEQYRHPFFVWLDGRDALRCSMDRVEVYDLRLPEDRRERRPFSEIELPIYPHIEAEVARDKRVLALIRALQESLVERFALRSIDVAKYQRGAQLLGLGARDSR